MVPPKLIWDEVPLKLLAAHPPLILLSFGKSCVSAEILKIPCQTLLLHQCSDYWFISPVKLHDFCFKICIVILSWHLSGLIV